MYTIYVYHICILVFTTCIYVYTVSLSDWCVRQHTEHTVSVKRLRSFLDYKRLVVCGANSRSQHTGFDVEALAERSKRVDVLPFSSKKEWLALHSSSLKTRPACSPCLSVPSAIYVSCLAVTPAVLAVRRASPSVASL
eukprot:jgi/Botrbrau1/15195/Bobra.0149s0056.1